MRALLLLLTAAAIPSARADILVNAAGATFPYPVYAKWFDEFHRLHPAARINYQPVGSGSGIRQLLNGTVDFAATDSPLRDDHLAKIPRKLLHFPTVLGAVVPIYNAPVGAATLNFTPEILAGVFLGTIRTWNDPRVRAANPHIAIPDEPITPVHRSDASGTTFIWTDFLSKTVAGWRSAVGTGTAVRWPVGIGARGNEGVAAIVKQTPYSIGYVELAYAIQNRIAHGRVGNPTGRFVAADARSMAAAAATASVPHDFRLSIVASPAPDAYPITSFSWLLVPARIEDARKRNAIAAFLRWMVDKGQPMAASLGYAPLPAAVAEKVRKAITDY